MDPEQLPLRDLHLPEAVGWWPLAPGWWFLIAVVLAVAGVLLHRQYQRWRMNAARRIALRELSRLEREYEAGANAQQLAKSVSELLRRGMLAYAPRAEVAGLTGESWLAWLDQGLPSRPFTEGAGKSLQSLPYRKPLAGSEDRDLSGLLKAAEIRLKTPLAGELR